MEWWLFPVSRITQGDPGALWIVLGGLLVLGGVRAWRKAR